MQRRRSYDAVDDTNPRSTTARLKPAPTPLSSISARVNQVPSKDIPFPRGGRQIGQSNDIRRSNSIERRPTIEGKIYDFLLKAIFTKYP